MKQACVCLLAGALSGCVGARAPARDAMYGVFDAIQNPPKEDRLAIDLRTLVQRYAEQALAAGPPEDLGEIAGRITTGVLRAVEEPTPAQRALVQTLVREALHAATTTMRAELPSLTHTGARLAPMIAESAGSAGVRLARGAMDASMAAIEAQGDRAGEGPIARAITTMAERTAGATVRGATEELRAELSTCVGRGADCRMELLHTASRSMVTGAVEGALRAAGGWLLVLVAAAGVWLTAMVGVVVWALRRRPSPGV